jgi:hypothetical protein
MADGILFVVERVKSGLDTSGMNGHYYSSGFNFAVVEAWGMNGKRSRRKKVQNCICESSDCGTDLRIDRSRILR